MAADPDLLAHLADIYEPELVIPWQMTPGYWLVLLIVLALVGIVAWLIYRHWQTTRPRRAALAELKQLNWQDPDAAAAINQLLKRLVQSYHPNHPLLSSPTQVWQQFIQQQLPDTMRLPELQGLLYQPPALITEAAKIQFWQASHYVITHFSVKTVANFRVPPLIATSLAEKEHA